MQSFRRLPLLLALLFIFTLTLTYAHAVTTKRMWSSPITGYAIDGYDAVAYFTDAEPRKGLVEHEFIWAGVAWHFANEGNLEAFKRNPGVYAPQFGGYGVGGVLKNVLLPPNPLQWGLYNKKLYLFSSGKAKRKFEQDVDAHLPIARENWLGLLKTLNE